MMPAVLIRPVILSRSCVPRGTKWVRDVDGLPTGPEKTAVHIRLLPTVAKGPTPAGGTYMFVLASPVSPRTERSPFWIGWSWRWSRA